ncbi:MAG: Gfo/Idh/MocA family protein [Blastocatellia bacterium]
MPETPADDYGLAQRTVTGRMAAPRLEYLPRNPRAYAPAIGLIGCGGIAVQHLNAYRHTGYRVAALCDRMDGKAREYAMRFYPDAFVTTDYRELLARPEIEVVDIATHPAERVRIIEDALRAGKHVLSQKPFVTDLDVGERLADLADKQNVMLAVNQNGRWAPHFSWMREALNAGLIGTLQSVNFTLHWNHNWIIGTPFEEIHHLVLYDFAIHWFDMTAQFFGDRKARQVYAMATSAAGQRARPPFLAQAMVEYDGGMAAVHFNANVEHGQEDRTYLAGTLGSLISAGPSLSEQTVTLHTAAGYATPELQGTWFHEGFHGAMAELLCAIEQKRPPIHNARENLRSLALCFAAIASAEQGKPIKPGDVRRVKDEG